MENPMSWTAVEETIHEAYMEWERQRLLGVCGQSLAMIVANSLRDKNLLRDSD
jgi:hypothetical protein